MIEEKFTHRFRCGMVAELTLIFDPAGNQAMGFRVEWSRKLKPARVRRLLAEYQQWRNESVLAALRRHRLRSALVIDTGPRPIVNVIVNHDAPAPAATKEASPHGRN